MPIGAFRFILDFLTTVRAARVVQLVAHLFHNLRVASSNPARVSSRFFFWQGRFVHMPVNAAVHAVVRSPGKAAPLGVFCLRYLFLFSTHQSGNI